MTDHGGWMFFGGDYMWIQGGVNERRGLSGER